MRFALNRQRSGLSDAFVIGAAHPKSPKTAAQDESVSYDDQLFFFLSNRYRAEANGGPVNIVKIMNS